MTRLQNQLNAWMEVSIPDVWQVFYGGWVIGRYYSPDEEEVQHIADLEPYMIHIQHNYISMLGHKLTEEPVYNIRIQIQGYVVETIKSVGVDNPDLLNMLEDDHYAEIVFDNTSNWLQEPLKTEIDKVQDAKYFLIDMDTMLCVSEKSKRVYVMGRVYR